MRKARQILPALFFVFQGTVFAQQAVNWEGTIDSAKAAASRSNRLVLVLFTADWCPSCHRLQNDLANQPGAAAALEANYVPVKLNYDFFQNTARQYGINRLPTTVILAPNASGDVLAVIPEAMPVDQYLSKLNGVAADARRRIAGVYAQIPASPLVGSQANVNPLRPADGVAAAPAASGRPLDPPRQEPGTTTNVASVTPVGNAPVKSAAAISAPSIDSPPTRGTGAPAASAASGQDPPIGLEGYCPVQLVEKGRWQKGNKDWGVIHRGRVYLFAGPEEQHRFLADPDRYAPVSSGNDVVLGLEVGHSVPGMREFVAQFNGHVYLFASEGTLKKFEANPPYYADRALPAIHPVSQSASVR